MRRFALLIAATALCASSVANASLLTIELRAQVASFCAITDMRPVDLAQGRLSVELVCNSENFRLELGGDLQGLPIQAARTNNASLILVGSGVSVLSDRPGEFEFEVDLGRDLTAVESVTASVEAI